MEEVILEVALVHRPVYTSLLALQALFTLLVHAFVRLPVDGLLPAFAVLAIVEEFALVAVLDLPVRVLSLQLALAAGEAVEEHASDHGPGLGERLGALAVRLARNEAALILVAVRPTNLALAVRQPLFLALASVNAHLTSIYGAVRHRTLLLHLSFIHAGHLADVCERIERDIGEFVAD